MTEHDLWIAAACLKSTVEAAIKAGDWKVDRARDPTMDLQYLANCFSSIQNREWVGLTDEEREEATGWSVDHIEAKLKEKNT
jgi:hypothetical protein